MHAIACKLFKIISFSPFSLNMQCHPKDEKRQQMKGIKSIKYPLRQLPIARSREINQRQRQKGADFKAESVSAHHQRQGILQRRCKQNRQIVQGIQRRTEPRLVSTQIENQRQHNAIGGIIKIAEAENTDAQNQQQPFPLLPSPHRQQAEEQGEKDIEVGNIFPKGIGMKCQHVKRLGNQGKYPKAQKIFFDIMGMQQPHAETIAEKRKGNSPNPTKNGILRKKHAAEMIEKHRHTGNNLQKARVLIRFDRHSFTSLRTIKTTTFLLLRCGNTAAFQKCKLHNLRFITLTLLYTFLRHCQPIFPNPQK